MKNIHVLPTDKPSRLCKSKITQKLSMTDVLSFYGDGTYNQHIYVTSDEEVKEGDWFIMSGFILRKCDYVDNYMIIDTTQGKHFFSVCKKIILTTDQDLIKDGVQAIDDEFLEWFVKNPSCEKVEVKKGFEDGTAWGYNFLDYKIIIPQEESNPFELPKALPDDIFYQSLGTKQETPEIDKTNWKAVYEDSLNMQKASNAGYESKIQELKQEIKRSYSGEEVIQLYKDYESYVIKTPINEVIGFSEWFIQNHYRFFSYETN